MYLCTTKSFDQVAADAPALWTRMQKRANRPASACQVIAVCMHSEKTGSPGTVNIP